MTFRAIKNFALVTVVATAALLQYTERGSAAESAASIYLLGSGGPQAAVLPPPGVFTDTIFYSYTGEANPNIAIEFGGNIAVGADVSINIAAPVL